MDVVQQSQTSISDGGPFSEALSDVKEPAATPARTPPVHDQPLPKRGVRWYWHKPAFSAKGQGISADIPHRAQIQRFCDADSNALEERFREQKDEIESAWWQEHSEVAEGPKVPTKSASPKDEGAGGGHGSASQPAPVPVAATEAGSVSKTVVDVAARRRDLLERETCATSWEEFKAKGREAKGRVNESGVLVRGKRWEVDLLLRLLSPCYWPEAQHRVMRGTWFVEKGLDWVPLSETVGDELETAFRREVWRPEMRHLAEQKQGIIAARINLATSAVKGTYALFCSAEEAYLCVDDAYSWVTRKMGSAAKGAALRRGYTQPHAGSLEVDHKAEEADNTAAAAPVDRLILAVHGIGQKLSGASIVDDATALRSLVLNAASDPELHAMAGGSGGRIELLPVQWRKGLTLGVDSLAERLMPANLEALRGIFHATAVEVLLYLTPLHCQDMLDSVVLSLNATYAKFITRNPCFKGTVSIVAHSLGSVLTWDILSCQPRWYATLAALRLSQGAADSSLAALERLSHRNNSPAGVSPVDSQPIEGSAEGLPENSSASEAFAAELSSTIAPSLSTVQEEQSLQPLRNEDFSASVDDRGGSGAGSSSKSSSDAPAASTLSSRAAAVSAGTNTDSATALAERTAAAAAATDGELPGGGGSEEARAADADTAASTAELSGETERLRQEIKELRTQLRASTAKNIQLPRQPNLRGVSQGGPGMTPEEAAQLQPAVTVSLLDFPVDQFICIGSPNGLFLALRKVDPGQKRGLGTPAAAKLMPGGGGGCDGLPAVNRVYNLYHPYDPVAYRMEPLAVEGGEKRRPVFADYHRGGRRIHIGLQEMSEDVGSAVSGFGAAAGRVTGNMWGGLRNSLGRAVHLSKAADASVAAARQASGAAPPSDSASQQAVDAEVLANARAPGTAFWRLTGGRDRGDNRATAAAGRMDFVLQESPTENQYLSAISSHFSYWSSCDTALLVARAVSGLDVLTGRPAADRRPGRVDGASGDTSSPSKNKRPQETSPVTPIVGVPSTLLSPQELVDRAWH